jgi:branched-chain amino acid transport system permease protein
MVLVQAVIAGLLLGGMYALVSVGLTLTFGVLRIVNFAHGEFMMIGMYITYALHQWTGMDPYLSCLIVGPLLFVFGIIVERWLIRPIIQAPHVVQIFVTFGLALFLQNIALMIWSADRLSVLVPYGDSVLPLGSLVIPIPRIVSFGGAMALCIGLLVFLHRTYSGKAIRATAEDGEAARFMGIDTERVYLFTFAIGAALAGIAGALLTPIYPVYPTVGMQFVLVAFIVVILGGLGSPLGAIVGGLGIGVIEVLSGFFISPAVQQALYFFIFLLVLILRPAGLFGHRGSEELIVT